MEFGWGLCHQGPQVLTLFKTNCPLWPRHLFMTLVNVILQLLVQKDTMLKTFVQRSHTFVLFKFHDFPGLENEMLKFSDFPGFP